jgi:hypothetical protein
MSQAPRTPNQDKYQLISLFLLATAQADSLQVTSDYVLELSEAVEYDFNANWVRVFPAEGELYMLHAAGGEYWKVRLDADLQLDNNDRSALTGRSRLFPTPKTQLSAFRRQPPNATRIVAHQSWRAPHPRQVSKAKTPLLIKFWVGFE